MWGRRRRNLVSLISSTAILFPVSRTIIIIIIIFIFSAIVSWVIVSLFVLSFSVPVRIRSVSTVTLILLMFNFRVSYRKRNVFFDKRDDAYIWGIASRVSASLVIWFSITFNFLAIVSIMLSRSSISLHTRGKISKERTLDTFFLKKVTHMRG